jgi:cytochrome c oxidase subunit III
VKYELVADVSSLPDHAFGPRTLLWWGVIGFIVIEAGAFLLAGGSYFFLMNHTTPWPPNHPPPGLILSAVFTITLLASELPNAWAERASHAQNQRGTRASLVVMSLAGLVLIAIRFMEFRTLNVRWDEDAYGSIVWALLLLHTAHLITDVADTIVLTVFSFVHDMTPRRFADVADGGLYWHFVVVAWLPIYALVYWVPRIVQ